MIKDQTTASQNGIYTVTTVGDESTNWVLTRATDADSDVEFSTGAHFFVESGTNNETSSWVFSTYADPFTFGTTAVTFAQFTGGSSYSAGDGLDLSGSVLSVNTGTGITITSDNVVIDTAWTGQAAIDTVGTITSGTWNSTVISATYGGTGLDTSSATGVLTIASGTWSTSAYLPVTRGGTGVGSFTNNGILYGDSANSLDVTAAGADGYFLYSNSGTPDWTNEIDGGNF